MNHNDAGITLEKEKYYTVLLIVAVLLVASTLRSPITSVGPLIPYIREDLTAPNALIGTINTLPLLAFGLFSPFVSVIARKFGIEKTLLSAMILLSVSVLMRSMAGLPLLLAGTFFVGAAVAVGNVLMPGLIKFSFPYRIGLMTGIYSVCMNVLGALAAGIAVPVADISFMSWRGSLQAWSIISAVTVIVLIMRLPVMASNRVKPGKVESRNNRGILKSKTAWGVTLYMGLQSFIPFSLYTWLPDILISKGSTEAEAGWMVALLQLGLLPSTFVIPILADKVKDQRLYAFLSGMVFFIGIFGIRFFDDAYIPVFLFLAGIAAGSTFSLSMMFFALRTNTPGESADLSGMAQSVGYLIAATGPIALGLVADVFESWNAPLNLLMLVALGIAAAGLIAGKDTKTAYN